MATSKDAKVPPIASVDEEMDALAARYKLVRRMVAADEAAARGVVEKYGSLPYAQALDVAKCWQGRTTLMERTTLMLRQQFLPRHINYAGIVFGGDILRTLERAATASAARLFPPHVPTVTRAVRALVFLRPVEPKQLMHVEATVVATWAACVCVMVRASVDDAFKRTLLPCHAGVFFVTADSGGETEPACMSRNVNMHVGIPRAGKHDGGESVAHCNGDENANKRPRFEDASHATDFFIAMAVASDLDTDCLCEGA